MIPISTPTDDAALVRRLLAGDEQAFTALVERLGPGLLRVARSLVGDHAAAEEVVQESWTAALDGLRGFQERASLKTWLFRILVNRAKTRRQREARSVPFSSLEADEGERGATVDASRFAADGHWASPPHGWDYDTPERLALRAEARVRIAQALAALPASQRAVVTLRDVEGFDSHEVCSVLEISESNQRVLLHRARGRLRASLEDYLDRGGPC